MERISRQLAKQTIFSASLLVGTCANTSSAMLFPAAPASLNITGSLASASFGLSSNTTGPQGFTDTHNHQVQGICTSNGGGSAERTRSFTSQHRGPGYTSHGRVIGFGSGTPRDVCLTNQQWLSRLAAHSKLTNVQSLLSSSTGPNKSIVCAKSNGLLSLGQETHLHRNCLSPEQQSLVRSSIESGHFNQFKQANSFSRMTSSGQGNFNTE
ncbi:unnamed protein product [Protopolystoma xenopodis]|uniref:Uncharacterized protein n=1 Tax=Protopolystoma xenopodis TaxID=117903 RepID=A0A448WJ33_9PLAT|nr:unnamed protein product [Protopolystoma xenopodis]